MHKILSLTYVLIIVSFGWAGFQLYLDRGLGLATPGHLFSAISFLIALGLVAYLHYKISRTTQRTSAIVSVFSIISSLNVLLSFSVILPYFFAYNHGGLGTAFFGIFMIATLTLSVILAITLLIKGEQNSQV